MDGIVASLFGTMQDVQPQGAAEGDAGAAGAHTLSPGQGPAVFPLTSHARRALGDAGTSWSCRPVSGSHVSCTAIGATVTDSTTLPSGPGAVQLPSHAAGTSNG